MSEVEVEEEYASVSDLADKIDSINQRVSVILQTYRNRNNNSSNRVSEDQLLQALDTQSQQIKQEYNLKLKQVEQDREFEVKRRLEAENEAENVQKLIDDVDVRKRKFRKRIDELLVAIQEANDALEANEEDRALKEKRNMGLEKEQDSLKGEVRELERKLDAESLVFQNVSSYAESFSVKSSNAKKFIETMESEYEKKIEILHKKLTDLKTQQEKKENKFKEEFTKQLTDIVAENQDILETSLEDVLARQKEFYDQSILSIHKTYESSDARIEELEELHANHQKKLEAVKKRFSELDVANENLKNSIKEQQSKLDELKRNPNKEINERNREIRNLKGNLCCLYSDNSNQNF
jgi:chromosome segregation ATPase